MLDNVVENVHRFGGMHLLDNFAIECNTVPIRRAYTLTPKSRWSDTELTESDMERRNSP